MLERNGKVVAKIVKDDRRNDAAARSCAARRRGRDVHSDAHGATRLATRRYAHKVIDHAETLR